MSRELRDGAHENHSHRTIVSDNRNEGTAPSIVAITEHQGLKMKMDPTRSPPNSGQRRKKGGLGIGVFGKHQDARMEAVV